MVHTFWNFHIYNKKGYGLKSERDFRAGSGPLSVKCSRSARERERVSNMKKNKKRVTAILLCVLVLAGCLTVLQTVSASRKASAPVSAACLTLEPTTLQSTVTASGTVKSASTTNVYTLVNGCVVKDVHIEVGDTVQAGDILCQLDSSTLEDSLEKQRLSLSVSQNSTSQNLSASEKQYRDAVNNLDNGLNTTVNSARSATESALRALEKAQQDYDDARADVDDGMNSQLVQAEEALDQAQLRLDRAEETYEKAKDQVGDAYREVRLAASNAKKERDAAQKVVNDLTNQLAVDPDNKDLQSRLVIAKADLQSAQQRLDFAEEDLENYETDSSTTYGGQTLRSIREAYEDAQTSRDSARKSLELAQAAVDSQLASYATALNEAQIAYDNALVSQQAAETSVRQGLEDQRAALNASRASSDTSVQELEIQSLEDQILDCTVTAPVSGTVTAVNVSEGGTPAGVLFVIEDTSRLELDLSIKEYDVGIVAEGMAATVRADALEDQRFSGELTAIAPAARAAAAGASSGSVEYAATVAVTDTDTPLRIGMSAKADIIVEERQDVFAVPYEALGVNAAGQDVVYAAVQGADGVYTVQEIPVTLGLESDLTVEVEGEGLTDGLLILSTADSAAPGQRITPVTDSGEETSSSGELMDMMMGAAQ